jgi:hypothetical protein
MVQSLARLLVIASIVSLAGCFCGVAPLEDGGNTFDDASSQTSDGGVTR